MRRHTDTEVRALRHHGDQEVGAGLVDLAVNVRTGSPPGWIRKCLIDEIDRLGSYPDPRAATEAVARRHGRDPGEVLVTHGAAEAFVLLARALRPRRPVVVHPQFTEPEMALRDVGCAVDRVVLPPPFDLADVHVRDDADMVVVGNPTNPTSRLHPATEVRALARPGRILVVDEAFMDMVPGEQESLAAARDVPGLVVVRSLTKQFGLAGLRAGYLLAARGLIEALQHGRPLWPVSSLALTATEACMTDTAAAHSRRWAESTAQTREGLVSLLRDLPGVRTVEPAAASFLLLQVDGGEVVRSRLRARGFAVRRCDTFPGLGPDWLRVAVRDEPTGARFVHALTESLHAGAGQCW
jgi:histidinol-phosphate aminotransferase